MKFSNKMIPLICILFLFIFFLACNASNGHDISQSNDIVKKLQEEVPFKIIVPTYFPGEIDPYPVSFSGPEKLPISENALTIGLTYKKERSIESIIIDEANYETIFTPSKPSSVYLDFSGTKVLEEETQIAIPSKTPSNSQVLSGLFYGWCTEGVNYQVTILGRDKNESLKVIDSMIKQIHK
jgi:hypothetical protein